VLFRSLCDLLSDFGLAVETAAHGREATALCARREAGYAVVLMDLHMPEMGGLDAARQIRALGGHAATPIVAITADTSESQRQACLDQGFAAVLHKPLEPLRLFETLVSLGERR
jgi:CheY-like chemotaxis protein